jgi:hypothetical protein
VVDEPLPETVHDFRVDLIEGVRDASCTGAVSRPERGFGPVCQPGWSIVVGPCR